MQSDRFEILNEQIKTFLGDISGKIAHDQNYWLVEGSLPIRTKKPTIKVWFRRNFKEWPQYPPKVWCEAYWIRREVDWHFNTNDETLCWCHGYEWYEYHSWPGKSKELIVSEGLRWLFESTRLLILRHWVGHQRGYKKWPKEWTAWGHYEEGTNEYKKERKQRRRQ